MVEKWHLRMNLLIMNDQRIIVMGLEQGKKVRKHRYYNELEWNRVCKSNVTITAWVSGDDQQEWVKHL